MLAASPQQLRGQTPSGSLSPASTYEARHLLAAGSVTDRMDSAGEQGLPVRGVQAGRWDSRRPYEQCHACTCQSNLQQPGSREAICLPVQQGCSEADKEHAAGSAIVAQIMEFACTYELLMCLQAACMKT